MNFILGIIVGVVATLVIFRTRLAKGIIHQSVIDGKDNFFLEVFDIDDLYKKDVILFRIERIREKI